MLRQGRLLLHQRRLGQFFDWRHDWLEWGLLLLPRTFDIARRLSQILWLHIVEHLDQNVVIAFVLFNGLHNSSWRLTFA